MRRGEGCDAKCQRRGRLLLFPWHDSMHFQGRPGLFARLRIMWLTVLFVGIPVLAAALAAWGIWRQKWWWCLPVVLVAAWPFLPANLLAAIDDVDDWVLRFVEYVEPRSLVMVWLLVDAAAVGCLIALWAGWSRAHWFWRLTALTGVPAALSLVKANEPIALAFVILPVIAAAAWWTRRIRDQRQVRAADIPSGENRRFRWQIRDALLLFIPVGLVALAVRSLVAGPFYVNWRNFVCLSLALVLLGLTSAS